ncbi:XK-related protein 8 isoform X2 [Ranitomeya imitator]|uniref:XK-related protein 8 isoform X2 n=1 Tax=Ranitomeya imitator TaxID=111125 RepID=UPI0037E95DCA
MLHCAPSIYRLQDLVFALFGTVAFLVDLGSDVWSTVRYCKAGDTAWAVVYIGLYGLSSSVLQLLSWGWYWVDRQDSEPSNVPADGDRKRCSDAGHATAVGPAASLVAAVPVQTAHAEVGDPGVGRSTTLHPPEPSHRTAVDIPPPDCPPAATPCWADPSAAGSEAELVVGRFWTSRFILRPSCLTVLHLLQLGYPLRCIHSLEVGIAAYRNPKEKKFKDYAYFLTHDISMMRLVETFLENTPQLILVLYIIIQREVIQIFQYVSICVSFICISWAILDYHQSLRLFLKGKQKLSILSSAIYYLWNFCLISSHQRDPKDGCHFLFPHTMC